LAYYPILALYNLNIEYVDLPDTFRSLLLATFATLILLVGVYLLTRSLEKSSVIVSLLMIMFLTYGHAYLFLQDSLNLTVRHSFLVIVEGVVFLGLLILILKSDLAARGLGQFLMVVSIALTAMFLFGWLQHELGVSRASAATSNDPAAATAEINQNLPDVYFIILDAHTRSDVLADRFGYDNLDFINALEGMGFYVGACSQSNYASTKLSLTSAFYGEYIDQILKGGQILPPLQNSALIQALTERGYRTMAFENRARGQFDLNEEIRFSRNQLAFGTIDLRGGLSEFERMLIDTSFMRFFVDTELIPGLDRDTLDEWELWEHYYQTKFILAELAKIPELPGPKFVFAHIMVPHAPFVFAPDGAYQRNDDPIAGYRANTAFIDNSLPEILAAILEKSDPQPIILVMGDHGPSTRPTVTPEMRMATLNAYLVGADVKPQFYPQITPVNAARIILNNYFGGNYDRLEDKSIYAYKTAELAEAELIPNGCQPIP
jgi:hypothetical protein